jgi:hypothetical protein
MNEDFRRRVERNTVLRCQNALSPLFEAVMNSIDAIREANPASGKIIIQVERDRSQPNLDDSHPEAYPVKSFTVRDNGIGVTDAHFEAFGTADTAFRADQGGKGLGRFLWLKAFDHAEITSSFAGRDGERYTRSFKLCLTAKGIEDPHLETAETGASIGTEVRLCDYRLDYQKEVPKSAEAISKRIIEHFLQYFVLGQMPPIIILDTDEAHNLQDIFAREVLDRTQSRCSFLASGQLLEITHFLVRPSFQGSHSLYFCSENKMVLSRSLAGRIANLSGAIRDDGASLMYAGYVSGRYLDTCSNPERTAFQIPAEDSAFGPGWETLFREAVSQADLFLRPYTQPIKESKEDRIRAFTQNTAPQFRPVVKHRRDLVDTIAPNVSDDKLDQELDRINQIYETVLRARSAEILQSLQAGTEDWGAFKEKYGIFIQEWNEAGISKLAQHVVHRKATIDFFKASLRRNPQSGKYCLEEAIHQIIFPLQHTSDDLSADQMNLWMIDEKLSFHYYLASNLQFSQQDGVISLPSGGGKKPDIIIYNNPSALVSEEEPFSSVTILEFKRPLRNDYTEEDNPIRQVYEYAQRLKSGRALDRHGRPIPFRPGTPIYAYVLCDPSATLTKQIEFMEELKPTPDGLGWVGYHSKFGVWIEVVTFAKLISDAEKRNASLFDQLNIPRQP